MALESQKSLSEKFLYTSTVIKAMYKTGYRISSFKRRPLINNASSDSALIRKFTRKGGVYWEKGIKRSDNFEN